MSPVTIGIIGIVVLLFAFIMGVHIAFAMLGVGLIGMFFLIPSGAAFFNLPMDLFNRFTDPSMNPLIMFILMGFYAAMSGMTHRLYDLTYIWFGQYRGGLSIATVASCALFACVTGSSMAEVATFGKVAYPEMKKYGYSDELAAGSIAGGGVLAPMIPPSTGMIMYGILTEQSIGRLFFAVLLPGILLAIIFAITVSAVCRIHPSWGPAGPKTSWKQKIRALPGLVEVAFVFLLVMGGMFAGLFTPSQAGAVGAAGALIICVVRRTFSWKALLTATRETMLIACMVFFLLAGAILFGHFLSLSTLTLNLINLVEQLEVPRLIVLLIIAIFYIIGGCVMDAMALLVLTIPIFAPVVFALGYNPIWYGVFMQLLGEAAVLTPPVGINVFVMKATVPELSLNTIFKGITPFLIGVFICMILIVAFPQIALFLPNLMMGK